MIINKTLQDLLGKEEHITIISYVVNCVNNDIEPILLKKPECKKKFNDALEHYFNNPKKGI